LDEGKITNDNQKTLINGKDSPIGKKNSLMPKKYLLNGLNNSFNSKVSLKPPIK